MRPLSRPNDGSLRVPVILIGIALPPPSRLKSGSTTFSSTRLMPVVVSDTLASMNSVPLKSTGLGLERVVAGELHDGAGHVELHVRNRRGVPSPSLNRPSNFDGHLRGCRPCRRTWPLPRWLSSLIFSCTVSLVNRVPVSPNCPSSCSFFTTSTSPGGRTNVVFSRSAPDHRRLRRVDGQPHDVFEPAAIDRHVERHRAAVDVRVADDAALRDERRVEKRRVDFVEDRVAVGAVDDRVIRRVQRHRMPAGLDDAEFRRVGFAVDVDAFELAAELPVRRQDAGDAR